MMYNPNNSKYLADLLKRAADKNPEYAYYLFDRVSDRLDSGRSMDSDEYRELLRLAA